MPNITYRAGEPAKAIPAPSLRGNQAPDASPIGIEFLRAGAEGFIDIRAPQPTAS